MLTYAMGRGLEEYDRCAVEQIVKSLEPNRYRFSALMLVIVKSDPFQKRRDPVIDGSAGKVTCHEASRATFAANRFARPGAPIALPWLEAMARPAAGRWTGSGKGDAVPRRMAFFYVPMACICRTGRPRKSGSGFPIPATLKPLAPYKDHLLVLPVWPSIMPKPWATGLATMPGRWPVF